MMTDDANECGGDVAGARVGLAGGVEARLVAARLLEEAAELGTGATRGFGFAFALAFAALCLDFACCFSISARIVAGDGSRPEPFNSARAAATMAGIGPRATEFAGAPCRGQ